MSRRLEDRNSGFEEGNMRVRVDGKQCQGHGVCYMTAPDVFAPREEDGHAEVLLDEVGPDLEAAARDGAEACPERAITVE
ncbi:ferredoxin [Thermobifida cellulosilytica]|nr:ferredoxin [Thermobifida cellulosilytica]